MRVSGDTVSGWFLGRCLVWLLVVATSVRAADDVVPTIAAPSTTAVTVNQALSIPVVATGGNLMYAATGLAPGLSMAPTTGIIAGTPTTTGRTMATLSVSNGAGTATAPWILVVQPPSTPIAVNASVTGNTRNSNGCYRISVPVALTVTITVDGQDSPTGRLTDPYLLLQTKDMGFVTNGTSSGVGQPAQIVRALSAGDYFLTIYGMGSNGAFMLSVSTPRTTIVSPLSAVVQLNQSFSYTIQTMGTPGILNADGLPPGLFLFANGVISGKPTAPGTYAVRLSAGDPSFATPATLSLVVTDSVTVVTRGLSYNGYLSPLRTEEYFQLNLEQACQLQVDAKGQATRNGSLADPQLTIRRMDGQQVVSDADSGEGLDARINGTFDPGSYLITVTSGDQGSGNCTLRVSLALPRISAQQFQIPIDSSTFLNLTAQGDQLRFSASALPTGLTLDPSTGLIQGTVRAEFTPLQSQVTVTNSDGSATAPVAFAVAYRPPVPSVPVPVLYQGVPCSFQVTASNLPKQFSAEGLPLGLAIAATTGVVSGKPTTGGSFTTTFRATNPWGTVSVVRTISVTAADSLQLGIAGAGEITATRGSRLYSFEVTTRNRYSLSAEGIDTDKGTLLDPELLLRRGDGTILASDSYSGAGWNALITCDLDPGVYLLEVKSLFSNDEGTFQVTAGFAIPWIVSSSTINFWIGESRSFSVTTANPATNFRAEGLPAGLAFDPTNGVISGKPQGPPGSYPVQLAATNNLGTATATLMITVAYRPPVITTTRLPAASRGAAYAAQIKATAFAPTFAIQGLPEGMSVDPTTGIIQGRANVPGAFALTVTITDLGGTVQATLKLVVNDLPQLVRLGDEIRGSLGFPGKIDRYVLELTEETALKATVTVTDTMSTGALELSLAEAITGRSLVTTRTLGFSEVLSPGVYAITLAAPELATGDYLLRITASPIGITASAPFVGWVGKPFTAALRSYGGPTTWSATGLPAGLAIDPVTGEIRGTPTEVVASVDVQVTASGDGGTATRTIPLIIRPPPIPLGFTAKAVTSGGSANAEVEFAFTLDRPTSVVVTLTFSSGVTNGQFALCDGPRTRTIASVAGSNLWAYSYNTIAQDLPAGEYTVVVSGSTDYQVSLSEADVQFAASAPQSYRVGEQVEIRLLTRIPATRQPAVVTVADLPPPLVCDPQTGVITGRVQTPGVFSLPVGLSFPNGYMTSTLSLTVESAIGTIAPGETVAGAIADSSGLSSYHLTLAAPTLVEIDVAGAAAGQGTLPQVAYRLFRDQFRPNSTLSLVDADARTGTAHGLHALDAGRYVIQVFSRATVTGTFRLRVALPAWTTAPPATLLCWLGEPCRFPTGLTAATGDFTADDLPTGLVVDPRSGDISGIPGVSGVYSAILRAPGDPGPVWVRRTVRVQSRPAQIRIGDTVQASLSANVPQAAWYVTVERPTAVRIEARGSASGRGSLATPRLTLLSQVAGSTRSGDALGSTETRDDGMTTTLVPGTYLIELTGTSATPSGTAEVRLTAAVTTVSLTMGVDQPFRHRPVAFAGASGFTATGLPEGLSVNSEDGTISGAPRTAGTFTAMVTGSNSAGPVTFAFQITVDPTIIRWQPTGHAGTILLPSGLDRYQVVLEQPTDLRIEIQADVLQTIPLTKPQVSLLTATGTAVTAASLFSKPGSLQAVYTQVPPGTFLVRVGGAEAGSYRVSLSTAALAILEESSWSAWVGVGFRHQITTRGVPSGFAVRGLPEALTYDAQSGLIQGTPLRPGTHPLLLTATDVVGSTSVPVTLNVGTTTDAIAIGQIISRGYDGLTRDVFRLDLDRDTTVLVDFGPENVDSQLNSRIPTLAISDAAGRRRALITGPANVPAWSTSRTRLSLEAGSYLLAVTADTLIPSPFGSFYPFPSFTAPTYRLALHQAAPVITSPGVLRTSVGVLISHQIRTDTGPVRYVAEGLPVGLSLDPDSGVISGSVAEPLRQTPVLVRAGSAGGTGSQRLLLTVVPPAPSLALPPAQQAVTGRAFRLQLAAGNWPASFVARGLPAGLAMDPVSGRIEGTPTAPGSATITVEVANDGGTTTGEFLLQVLPPPPVIPMGLAVRIEVGTPLSYRIPVDNGPAVFSASNLPETLMLDAASGVLRGTVVTPGILVLHLTATTASGTAEADVEVRVVPHPPALTSASEAQGQVGKPFAFTCSVSNGPVTFTTADLPPGLTLDPATGTVAGVPTTAGRTVVHLRLEAAEWTVTTDWTLTILPPEPVLPEGLSLQGQVGRSFLFEFAVASAGAQFTAVDLPPGLVMDALTGVIHGIPTDYGTWSVAIRLTTAGGFARTAVAFQVLPPYPVLPRSGLLTGQVGEDFAFACAVPGVPATYSAEGLPPGLAIDSVAGVVGGRPTAAGSWLVHLRAENAAGTDQVELTFEILPAVPVLVAGGALRGRVGEPFTAPTAGASDQAGTYWAKDLPAGLKIDPATGIITGIPTVAGVRDAVVGVVNAGGSATSTMRLIIARGVVDLVVDSVRSGALSDQDLGEDRYRITRTVPGWISLRLEAQDGNGPGMVLVAGIVNAQGTVDLTTESVQLIRLSAGVSVVAVIGTPGVGYRISYADGDIEAFVTRFYRQCLQREPDAAGLADWSRRLRSRELSGGDLARGFILSQEFQGRGLGNGDYLRVLYRAFFDREPDDTGFLVWMGQLTSDWARQKVLDQFILAQEFTNLSTAYRITPVSPDFLRHRAIQLFVERFYLQCLSRVPDVGGINGWVSALEEGRATGADVAAGFVGSPEFLQTNVGDRRYLDVLYRAFFDREGDPGGMAAWDEALRRGTSRPQVLSGFIHAQEFITLCSRYGIIPFPSGG